MDVLKLRQGVTDERLAKSGSSVEKHAGSSHFNLVDVELRAGERVRRFRPELAN